MDGKRILRMIEVVIEWKVMKNVTLLVLVNFLSFYSSGQVNADRYVLHAMKFNAHEVVLDEAHKIISWIVPQSSAYDQFLHQRWNFIKYGVPDSPGPPPRSSYPQYYFYCGYDNENFGQPDTWMNDVGEKIPNWFESARLYYAYTGDTSVMILVKNLIDYAIEHGTSAPTFAWPRFPYTTTNAGDLEFRGFTGRLALHEIQVDHAGDMGLTYYRLYLFTGNQKYKTAALQVAQILAEKARSGSATQSVWPYRVIMDSGKVTAEYGANWFGAYELLKNLVDANTGDVSAFRSALDKTRDFMLQYPMKTGFWTDGHTDTQVNSNTYRSNMSASNAKLYILDHPEFDPNWKVDIPELIQWTEKYFVFRCRPGEPATQWGANLVGEQDDFLPKMDYQTARYGAECARWYAISGDETYKEKAYRSLNWVTYCNDSNGMAYESPVSVNVNSWWSDCYGEAPRMFYHAFAGIPEWAPPGENHILYSAGILREVRYEDQQIQYTVTQAEDIEYLRLTFRPLTVTINDLKMNLREDLNSPGYILKDLGNGDYAVKLKHDIHGKVVISGGGK